VKEVSPAGDAGLIEGDIVTQVNGQKIGSLNQFRDMVEKAKSGSYLRFYVTRVARGGGGRDASFFVFVQVP
jgi:S1-C subfamily serine protease